MLAQSQNVEVKSRKPAFKLINHYGVASLLCKTTTENTITSGESFRRVTLQEMTVKKEIPPAFPLNVRSNKLPETTKDHKMDKIKCEKSSKLNFKFLSCSKCNRRRHSNYSEAKIYEKRPKGVKCHKMVSTRFSDQLNFKNCCLQKLSWKGNTYISGHVAKWTKRMNVQTKTVNFNLSIAISILSFLDNCNTVCDSNSINIVGAMRSFHISFGNPPW